MWEHSFAALAVSGFDCACFGIGRSRRSPALRYLGRSSLVSRSKDATTFHALHVPHSPMGSGRESERATECALKYSQHMQAYSATTYATPFSTDDMVSAWCVHGTMCESVYAHVRL